MGTPFHLGDWIERNREALRPPVANRVIFEGGGFIVMVVGGPNSRTDFHVNESGEFFHQIEGEMVLRTVQGGGFVDVGIGEGQVYMLPPGVPHSPRRGAGSAGLVVEKVRSPGEVDRLQWYCPSCCHRLYEESFHLTDIETQFAGVFERYAGARPERCPECSRPVGE